MPWKELSVFEQRLAMIHRIVTLKRPVAQVAREFSVSRKTVHKWLKRYHRRESLADQSRRPRRSPAKTQEKIEQAVLDVRRRHNWGPRKIHRVLSDQQIAAVPSIRTVAAILQRCGCVGLGQEVASRDPALFERARPNELWQLDHKGPLEVARQRIWPLSVLDDYSRYCLCLRRVADVTMQTTWDLLWGLFEQYGLPGSILCDNAFSAPIGLSWFDARLVRLDITPIHGRPYHPQTQGKVERFNGTVQRELVGFDARRDSFEHFDEDAERFRMTYNTIRPHEALGDLPPVTRFKCSQRARPPTLPTVNYPPGTITRRVSYAGDFRFRNARIVVGRALRRETVMIEERDQDIAVYYAWKLLRVIPRDKLGGPRSHKMV
jgi:transposase InsO family protein